MLSFYRTATCNFSVMTLIIQKGLFEIVFKNRILNCFKEGAHVLLQLKLCVFGVCVGDNISLWAR